MMGLAVILLAVVLAGAIADRYYTKKQLDKNVELEKQEAFAKGMTYDEWKRLEEEAAIARERAETAVNTPPVQAATAEAEATGGQAAPVEQITNAAERIILGAPDVTHTPEEVESLKSRAVLVHTSMGTFEIRLSPDHAPVEVKNFLYLVGKGFYDGMPFYRLYPRTYLQTGSPTGLARGTAGYELPMPGNNLPALATTVAMLPTGDESKISSEFCIFLVRGEGFTGQFPVFGWVAGNWDVVEKAAFSDWDGNGYLYDRAYITHMEIVDKDDVPPEIIDPAAN
jgi:cyclophilin family peptidyl-prolyl cis-trans isomerase